jgi:hypothetical protein
MTSTRPTRLLRATALALGLVACHDPTGAPADADTTPAAPPSRIQFVVVPNAPTLSQVGVDLRVSMRDGSSLALRKILVDSGTAAERDETGPFYNLARDSFLLPDLAIAAYAPGPGAHRITIVVADTGGHAVSASITRTFDLPDVPYAATVLPDLGAGGGVRWVNARGDVAGWVRTPAGRTRPAVWTGGSLRVIDLPDTAGAVAVRVNGAGDVLLQPSNVYSSDSASAPRVLRADGTLLTIRPVMFEYYPVAVDLNDRRIALTSQSDVLFGSRSALFDVARGEIVDSTDVRMSVLNANGQMAGMVSTSGPYRSLYLVTRGFALPASPGGPPAGYCDLVGRYVTWGAIDLDDSSNLLATRCGALALLSPDRPGLWADRYVGLGQARLSRQGGLVASLDRDGSIFLWRLGTTRVSRVRLLDGAWRVDSLATVNGEGAIAAHGVERATGRGAALLLTPR